MSAPAQENEKVIRRLYQEVSLKMLPCGEAVDFTNYTVSGKPCCLDSFGKFFADMCASLCDCHLTIKSIATKEDKVMVHYTVSGTQKSDFMGVAATGEKMVVTGVDVFRVADGKVVEHWSAAHQLSTPR